MDLRDKIIAGIREDVDYLTLTELLALEQWMREQPAEGRVRLTPERIAEIDQMEHGE